MRQSVRNRPPGFFGPNNEAQRRVASSDTRQMNLQTNAYEQQLQSNNDQQQQQQQQQQQRNVRKQATSQSRPSKDLMNRSGFKHTNKQNSSAFLLNASDLLSRGDQEHEDDQAQLQRPGPQAMTRNAQQNINRKHSQPANQRGQQNRLTHAGEAYQSSLLTRYVKQPPMPTSQSIHSALNHERTNGWPSLAPVRQAVQPPRAPQASGIPRPTQFSKSKNKTGRAPSQGPLAGNQRSSHLTSNKVKYAFQTPITYQNEQEIMKKIFGANGMVKRTNSDNGQYANMNGKGHPSQQSKLNQTAYSQQQPVEYGRNNSSSQRKKTPEMHSAKMPPKNANKRKQTLQDPHRESVRQQYMAEGSSPVKNQQRQNQNEDRRDRQINQLLGSSAVQAYSGNSDDQQYLVSSPPRRIPTNNNQQTPSLTVTEYSEPRSDQRMLQKKNLMHQNARSPAKITGKMGQEDVAQDSAERAFFELQDAKVNFFQEKTDHTDKMEQRRINQTFTNGFYKDNQQPASTTASSSGQGLAQGTASRSNGFGLAGNNGGNPMLRTMGTRFAADKPLIGDDKDLKSDQADLNRDDLRERLFVAEKVMKTLFKRNKELEEMQPAQVENGDGNICERKCCREERENSDDSPTPGNHHAMKEKVKELERQLAAMEKGQRDKATEPQSYKDFMTMRLEQSQAEAKRHFENYVNVRDQLNNQMDKSLLATPDTRSNVTPKSIASLKGNKLRNDLHQRAHEANLQEQELVLKRASDAYTKGLAQIEQRLLTKDTAIAKADAKVKMLNEEVERRKFMEAKVQTYVRSLIEQNEKCKTFIRGINNTTTDGVVDKARDFMHKLETSQFDEHDGQSTENDEDEEADAEEDCDGEEEATEVEEEIAEDQDVAISDIV